MKRTYYTKDQIEQLLTEHVLKGDRGDGIPNVLSADNCIVDGIRQKKMTEKRMVELSGLNIANCDQETLQRIERNRTLIDLRNIPSQLSEQILLEYDKEAGKSRSKMFNYFVTHKLKNLLEDIGEY